MNIETIKEFIESNVPSEVIDGVCSKVGRFRQHYLQQNWVGEDAIKAVEEATGKPNSISIQYRYDRKGRHPINEGVIGTRSLNYFVKEWMNPYISEYASTRLCSAPKNKEEPVTKPDNDLYGVEWNWDVYTDFFETCTSEELLKLVALRVNRIKEGTHGSGYYGTETSRKTINLIFDEIQRRVEVYAREGDQY